MDWQQRLQLNRPSAAISPRMTPSLWQLKRFDFEKFFQTIAAEFTSVSRLLVAPERREHIERTAVDVDASSAHASCDTPCARLIVRPHRARETIYAVVCDAHSVIFVRVRENAHYRSKDFLLGDCHVRRHSTEHGRFYKVP